jgi:hypothetical protein
MKILKLLQELYLELKVFNENVECFSCLKECKREDPMRNMSDAEIFSLKGWINKCLCKAGLEEDKSIYLNTDGFLSEKTRYGTERARDLVRTVLGYGSFGELVTAWRQAKGGAA